MKHFLGIAELCKYKDVTFMFVNNLLLVVAILLGIVVLHVVLMSGVEACLLTRVSTYCSPFGAVDRVVRLSVHGNTTGLTQMVDEYGARMSAHEKLILVRIVHY